MGRIDMEGVTKVFGEGGEEIVAVDHLDLTINDGEFLVLVGPSGCGKSTTLRTIAGLEEVSDGTISIDGEDITDEKPKDRDIAMVFQNYALYPHMTARENMSFGLKMTTDLHDEEIDDRVRSAAGMMGIEDLLESKPGELSGGQQQRVALGRAIVREPKVFLMDEPLSNLDAKLRTTMRTELQDLQQRLETTAVYVTHDQTEAMTMGDRIVVLDEGDLQQVGTPLECYQKPNNVFVAGFIGSPGMNFLDVTLENGTLVHEAFAYEISEETAAELREAGPDLILGVRPEDIEVVTGMAEPNRITVQPKVVEPVGDMTYVHFELGGTDMTATVSGDRHVQVGMDLDVVFPEERIHVFDAETTEAVKNSRRELLSMPS
ncbi:ABC transporter ATP-binding protein [Halalkalicoccus subterraneus]|uniref:ABC transporter ATP-binding protein n=1 Tax=Halalkalicoccus subterraneus TaxID=2675002 RepID=UPI000EFD3F9D|nr:sn-glycerol-3-phosphate ABC transporter ATP-binding protein UgpC [Halalkalicoccus subterraneus]